jgi:hypothetical protein
LFSLTNVGNDLRIYGFDIRPELSGNGGSNHQSSGECYLFYRHDETVFEFGFEFEFEFGFEFEFEFGFGFRFGSGILF